MLADGRKELYAGESVVHLRILPVLATLYIEMSIVIYHARFEIEKSMGVVGYIFFNG